MFLRKTNRNIIEYYYPMWHRVSFTIIAEYHINELRKYFYVVTIDELSFRYRDIYSNNIRILHPFFFIAMRDPKYLLKIADKSRALIAIDVADTDRLGNLAVNLANVTSCCIVPSSFCKEVFEISGVKVPVYVVPHGLSELWYQHNLPIQHQLIRKLYEIKRNRNYIYLLYILMHSGFRKGANQVYEVYKEISKMYPNVKLVVKFGSLSGYDFERLSQLTEYYFCEYLTERELVTLYDICDVYLLFSIGGGFEHCGLQAISRGLVTLASDIGSWTDYLPQFCLIPHDRPVKVFSDQDCETGIHCGYGYPVNVEKAIDKLKDVIENLDDYKARVREYWNKIGHQFKWSAIGLKLKQIIERYM